jgi:multidrug transporter EmrE-like cation transporter
MSMGRILDYGYILATIVLTVYGQIILKARIGAHGALPTNLDEKLWFLVRLLFDPLIFSGFAAAFVASFAWMAAMTKFDLSHAYPFMSLNFAILLLLSGWLLNEPISVQKILGVALIVFGTIVAARG